MGRGDGAQGVSAEGAVDNDVFQKWVELSSIPVGKELQSWWLNLPPHAEGELEAWKASDADTALKGPTDRLPYYH